MVFVVNVLLLLAEIVIFKTIRGTRYVDKRKIDSVFLVVSWLQLTLLLGMRHYTVGIDSRNYMRIYNSIHRDFGYNETLEIGYRLLMRAIPQVDWFGHGREYVLCFLIVAILTTTPFFIFINKFSKDKYMSVLVYQSLQFYYFAFNMVRESLAIAVVVLAITLMFENKNKSSLLLFVVAITIHTSAIVAFPIWFIWRFRIPYSKKLPLAAAVLCGVFFVYGERIVHFFLQFFPVYQERYINSVFLEAGNILNPFMYLAILIICTVLLHDMDKQQQISCLMLLLLAGTTLYFIAIRIVIAHRITSYFTIAVIILLPTILWQIRSRKNRLIYLMGAYGVILFYNFSCIYLDVSGMIPYRFFWQ